MDGYLCVGVVEVVDGHLLVLVIVVLVSILLLIVVLVPAPLWLACNSEDCKQTCKRCLTVYNTRRRLGL